MIQNAMPTEAPKIAIASTRQAVLGELAPTLKLAGPVVLSELGWMIMAVVDTVMVGPLGASAIAAVGFANILFYALVVPGYGLLLGLDPLVSQAYGAGKIGECNRWLIHGLYAALLITPAAMAAIALTAPMIHLWGMETSVIAAAKPCLSALGWSVAPILVFTACRRYLQAINVVRPIMFALISANGLNVAANVLLIHGKLGLPALGAVGSAWSTVIGRAWMALVLIYAVLRHNRSERLGLFETSWRPAAEWMSAFFRMGAPIAAQVTLEVAVFALAAAWAGRFGSAALAAHEVVLQAASVTFMVPFGISSAGAVRVGQAIGEGDVRRAGAAGLAAIVLGAGFMALAGLAFLLLPRTIASLFTRDAEVIATASVLLVIAAAFQLFDGLQVVASGALRGAGETRLPMICHALAHWGLGLPLGFALAFRLKLEVAGIWAGLCAGLIAAGVVLMWAWVRTARRLARAGGEDVVAAPAPASF